MCGICGVLSRDGASVSGPVVSAMTAALDHRGPDEARVYVEGSVGLGHTRLKIIDLSPAARQPMGNEDGSVWVVFNGEVYNYRELRATLKTLGHAFRSESDTEVILHLYEERGERCVEELDGMFAFALWDGRRHVLLLARDRVGKKPLFWYQNARLFAFASEMKALLRHPSIPAEIDESAIPGYFVHGYVPTPATLYRGISSVPPGYTMTVASDGRTQARQYWDLSFATAETASEPALADARQVRDRVRTLVTNAVRKRLYADVPLGVFLSGGVDSCIVVGVMSRLMDRPVKTFTIGFAGDKAFDETAYARIVAQRFQTDHTEFVVEPEAVDLIETLAWHHDGPFGDSSGIPTFIVSRLARQHVTVALTGDGGDELFAGYSRFHAALMAERVPASVARWGNALLSLLREPRNYRSPVRRAQRFFRSAGFSFYERYARWITLFHDDLRVLLAGKFDGAGGEADRLIPFGEYTEQLSSYTPLSRLLFLNMKTYLLDDLLVKMDRMTMAHGLEARSPFLDRALVEYAALLPDRMKLRRGTTKYILKQAFSDLMPSAIRTRGKMGFGVPLGAWFRGDLREYVHDMLLGPDARIRGYLNQPYVAELVHEHVRGGRDHGFRLWAILTFEVWLRLLPRWAEGSADVRPVVSSTTLGTSMAELP